MRKNVLITGGAGGIGSEIVKRFIEGGFFVHVIDIDTKGAKELLTTFGKDNINVINVDVTDESALKNYVLSLKDFSIEHIITVAGRALCDEWKGFLNLGLDSVKKSVELNLLGHLNVIHEFAPFLTKTSNNKSVLMISSINALGGFGLPAYSAAKAGLVGFMNATAFEFGDLGIRINVLSPGTIVTEATKKEPKDFGSLLNGTAINKFATADEVADLSFRICNDFTSVTGQNFIIDAGQSISRIK